MLYKIVKVWNIWGLSNNVSVPMKKKIYLEKNIFWTKDKYRENPYMKKMSEYERKERVLLSVLV